MSEAREALENAVEKLAAVEKEIASVSMEVGTALRELLSDEPNSGQEFLEAAVANLGEASKEIRKQIENLKDESEAEENPNG